MKILRTVVLFATLLIGGIMVEGCGNSTTSETRQSEQKEMAERDTFQSNFSLPLASVEANALLDSLTRINIQMATINHTILEQDDAIKKNMSAIVEVRRTALLSILVAYGIGIVSLIISILAIVKTKAANERVRRHRQEIEELKHLSSASEARFENATRNMGISASRIHSQEYSDLSSRIDRIECRLEQGLRPIASTSRRDVVSSDNKISSKEQKGYFDLPKQKSATEGYFKCLFESKTSDACFHVEVRNGKAVFYPLEGTRFLNDVKSYDNIKLALEIQGTPLAEAAKIRVENPGEAILIDDRWEITKKVKIELTK